MWSPKRNTNGAKNHYYDSMREVSPGDIIFSFNNTYIPSLGVAQSNCYECPKPPEFGTTGQNWERIGWKVNVRYHKLHNVIRPREHMTVIGPLLPNRYSPLRQNGKGLQGVYLTELNSALAGALISLIGHEATAIAQGNNVGEVVGGVTADTRGLLEWEEHLRSEVESDDTISETEKRSLILSRIGQGRFKDNVKQIELRCRITKVDRIEHLRASHLKPWRDSNNSERLDGENGLLLTPSIDHLLDRGFISFENNGDLLVSPVAHRASLEKMGVAVTTRLNVGSFTQGQKSFLDFHRDEIFLQKRS